MPLLEVTRNARWLTVGDSGADAYALQRRGVKHVVASSIATDQILTVQRKGFLEGVEVVGLNAEVTGLDSGAFDYVLVKEAYHHFPRPPLAFYELHRVARSAVVFIEPAEQQGWRAFDAIRRFAKRLLRPQAHASPQFEESGNFLFRLNTREFYKMATAMQFSVIAVRRFNDFYVPRLAGAPVTDSLAFFLERLGLYVQDMLCRLYLMNWGLVSCISFKEGPSETVVRGLRRRGYLIEILPKNPYI